MSVVDSATVSLSTIKVESILTGNAGRILVGYHDDEELGSVSATPFFQFDASDIDVIDEATTAFDYAALVLYYDGYSFYDTTASTTLAVHQVTETIEPGETGYLLATDYFSFEQDPLSTVTFSPKPNRDDSLEIVLSDHLGLDLYTKIITGDSKVSSNEEFRKYIKGMALVPDNTSSGSIMGFTLKSELRVYYRDKSVTPVKQKFVSMPISADNTTSVAYYFTNITPAKNLITESLATGESRLSSDSTSGMSFIQSGTGLAIRVDFPHLQTLKSVENMYIVKAQLQLFPVRKSFDGTMPLPATLYVDQVDKRNDFYQQSSTGAVLVEDVSLGRDSYYLLDVTAFVKEKLATEEFNENALVLIQSDADLVGTLNRVFLHARSYDYATKLYLYYATLNN
ncbi:MAG: DUF4270 domain-containing protein [Bacteroidia bacterium]|nr:DUF4270 domain-containing protein [Bacteroidia bacterium]